MAYTVPVSFDFFFQNINLSGDHHSTASARRKAVVSLLENEFEILDSFPTGSVSNHTAVTGYADLDVMVVLHWSKHIKGKKPSEVLESVQSHLSEYRTGRRNGQAVTLYYDTWPNVDIVPVSRVLNENESVKHYQVPNMNDESWIVSRPRKHSRALNQANEQFGEEFKQIVKMLKWWNHQHSSLMQSYHIEKLALNIFESQEFLDFSWEIFSFFDNASKSVDSYLEDDDGSVVDRYLVDDPDKRKEIVKRLRTAREKTQSAWHLTYDGRKEHQKAIEIWRQVFGNKFPAYG